MSRLNVTESLFPTYPNLLELQHLDSGLCGLGKKRVDLESEELCLLAQDLSISYDTYLYTQRCLTILG